MVVFPFIYMLSHLIDLGNASLLNLFLSNLPDSIKYSEILKLQDYKNIQFHDEVSNIPCNIKSETVSRCPI